MRDSNGALVGPVAESSNNATGTDIENFSMVRVLLRLGDDLALVYVNAAGLTGPTTAVVGQFASPDARGRDSQWSRGIDA